MKKNAIIITVATLMLISSFAMAFEGQISSGQSARTGTHFLPDATNTYSGNVYIYANGTVSNSTVISGGPNSYILNMNVTGSLFIYRSDIVLHGNGLNISSASSDAMLIINASYVTVTDVYLFSSLDALFLSNSYYFTAADSHFKSNSTSSNNAAAYLETSDHASFVNDSITSQHTYGLYLFNTREIYVNGSSLFGSYAIYIPDSTSMVYLDNDVFSAYMTMVYFDGNLNNNTVIRNSIFNENNGSYPYGVSFYSSIINNVNIENNTFNNIPDSALYIGPYQGINLTIDHNKFLNILDPVYIGEAYNVLVSNNTFYGMTGTGLEVEWSYNTTISWNTFTGNTNTSNNAVYADYCIAGLLITHNNIFINSTSSRLVEGIDVNGSSSAVISGNVIVNASTGINVSEVAGTVTILHNEISIPDNLYYNSTGILVNFTGYADISFNTVLNTHYAVLSISTLSLSIYGNNLSMDNTGIFITGGVVNNVNVVNNEISLNHWLGDGIFGAVEGALGWNVLNNTILSPDSGISLSWEINNLTVSGNYIYDPEFNGIFTQYDSNVSISLNTVRYNESSYQQYPAIEVEYALYGASISHNTVLGDSSTYNNDTGGIFVYGTSPAIVFNNSVNSTGYGIEIAQSASISVFNNALFNDYLGLKSIVNDKIGIFSNLVSNSTGGLESEGDYALSLSANTISNASMYLLTMLSSTNTMIYHNNFLNTSNDSVLLAANSGSVWNLSSPVGGNYWSSYTPTGASGFGSRQYNISANAVDYLPLNSQWKAYTITFAEMGLPAGTSWTATLGSSSITSTMPAISFNPAAAIPTNMSFTVSQIPGYRVSSHSGIINVNQQSVTVVVSYSPTVYGVTFSESTLPAGASWSVTLDGHLMTSTSGSITFTVANGTYNYTIGVVAGYHPATGSGTVAVNGTQLTEHVSFAQNMYSVRLKENELPAGTLWSAKIGTTTMNTTSTEIEFTLASGTYPVVVSGPSGYTVTAPATVTVNNANTTISATFSETPVYTLLVTEKGLSYGSTWTFTMNGKSYTTALSALTVHTVAGTYSINATGPSGYSVSPGKTTLTVNGNTTFTVDFTSTVSSATSSGSGSIYLGIGIGIVVGAIAAALGTMFYTGTGVFSNMKKGKGGNP